MKNKVQLLIAVIVVVMLFLVTNVLAGRQGVANDTPISYLPLVRKDNAAPAPTHILFVFSTTATTAGNAGGRTGMNAICSNEDPASHLCTRNEIENAFVTTGVYFKTPFQKSWVDNHSTTEVDNSWNYDNCTAWSSNGVNGFAIADNASGLSKSNSCSLAYHVTCCKWVP